MLREALEALDIRPEGTYADLTMGGAGHSRAILERLGSGGRLIAFDQDEDAWANAPEDPRFLLVRENFRHLSRFLKLHHALPLDGLLADLGVSSHQFDTPGRGFSTRYDAPLDMRMDRRSERTAAGVIQEYSEQALSDLFGRYGELRNARSVARALVQARSTFPLRTVGELKAVLDPLVKGHPPRYWAQVFQALRIAVNDELGALEALGAQAADVLRPGGRLVMITFHSLEDRLVKNLIRTGRCSPDMEAEASPSPFRALNKKPLTATAEEIARNPRARSAKLRAAERKGITDTGTKP